MHVLKQFRCYFKSAEFKVITEYQYLKNFLPKAGLSKCYARQLEFWSQFQILSITLTKRRGRMLGYVLSRAPYAASFGELEVYNLHIIFVQLFAADQHCIHTDQTYNKI